MTPDRWMPAYTEPDAGERARKICEHVRSMRQELGLRKRLPLRTLWIISTRPIRSEWLDEIASECNVRSCVWLDQDPSNAIAIDFKALGPALGSKMKPVAASVRAGRYAFEEGALVVDGVRITNYTRTRRDVKIGDRYFDETYLTLDLTVTPELEREGLARDFVRAVQDERKRLGLDVRAEVNVMGDFPAEWSEYIAGQVLARSMSAGSFDVVPA